MGEDTAGIHRQPHEHAPGPGSCEPGDGDRSAVPDSRDDCRVPTESGIWSAPRDGRAGAPGNHPSVCPTASAATSGWYTCGISRPGARRRFHGQLTGSVAAQSWRSCAYRGGSSSCMTCGASGAEW
ncbi:hypothetical protein Shyhy02_42500 [Streptomyces hygroscopicus subsp. hygroscopicus]|nr:hypothetical protein Shyhy02_42500 [Streptomyces hygroscopicus subsp. hygroscopicus]